MRETEKKYGYHPRADSLGRPADSLKKLPPALIISAEIDPLADHGLGTCYVELLLYCIVLHCIALYCIVLHCSVL